MKRFILTLAVLTVLLIGAAAFAATPFRQAVSMDAGSGSFTYSNGVNNAAFSAWQLQYVVFGASATSTQTVSTTCGTVTNLSATEAVTATDQLVAVTNDSWHFINDKVLLTSSDTNAFTAYLIGLEQ